MIYKIIISKLHSASVNYVKIKINGVHVFILFIYFAIADLKKSVDVMLSNK